MPRRTYVDTNVLIAAFRAQGQTGLRAMEVLDDPSRSLIVSDAVWLELMPKAIYQNQQDEMAFYEEVFSRAERRIWNVNVLYQAHELAEQHGIAAMDATHIAIALESEAVKFISAEKSTKPMFRVQEGIVMRSIIE